MAPYRLIGGVRADTSFRSTDFSIEATTDGQYQLITFPTSPTPRYLGYLSPDGRPEVAMAWLSVDGGFSEVSGRRWDQLFVRRGLIGLAGAQYRQWRTNAAQDLRAGLILRLLIPDEVRDGRA